MFKRCRFAFAVALIAAFAGFAGAQDASTPPATDEKNPSEDASLSFSWPGWLGTLSDYFHGIPNKRVVGLVSRPEALSYRRASSVWTIADGWLQGKRWGGQARVNEPYVEGGLNIYIVRQQFLTEHNLSNLSSFCPCSYLPGSASIVCVEESIERALRYFEGPPGGWTRAEDLISEGDLAKFDELANQVYRSFFLEWIIAHEIGHFVSDHNAGDLAR
jgi:hypothetical protein